MTWPMPIDISFDLLDEVLFLTMETYIFDIY